MNSVNNKFLVILTLILVNVFFSNALLAKPLQIVAAENFYGALAQQIGGPYVSVTSILKNPNQDPHLFSANATTARNIANADIIVYNGINYDPWMEKLLAVTAIKPDRIIVIANLLGKKPGANPHLWYDPLTMPHYAQALTRLLIQLDPTHRDYFLQQVKQFNENYQQVINQITEIKHRYQATPVIATEPVFNLMSDALGLKMYGEDFQLSIMNDTAPSATQTAQFENYLRNKSVRVLFYNDQVVNPTTSRMQALAQQMGIPTVGISETQPAGKTYVQWLQDELTALNKALQG